MAKIVKTWKVTDEGDVRHGPLLCESDGGYYGLLKIGPYDGATPTNERHRVDEPDGSLFTTRLGALMEIRRKLLEHLAELEKEIANEQR